MPEEINLNEKKTGKPSVVHKTLGRCPVCDHTVYEYSQYIRMGRRFYHNGCIPAATLKTLLEVSSQLKELTDLFRKTLEGEHAPEAAETKPTENDP